jgi:hypothetical protein
MGIHICKHYYKMWVQFIGPCSLGQWIHYLPFIITNEFTQNQVTSLGIQCRNPNIGFMTKCEVQGPTRLKVCLGVKHTFTNGGKCKGWSSMILKCTCAGAMNVHNFGWKGKIVKLGPRDTIKKALKHQCLKCPCIVHLDLICMSYDQKNGWESNWEFDSPPQTLWN